MLKKTLRVCLIFLHIFGYSFPLYSSENKANTRYYTVEIALASLAKYSSSNCFLNSFISNTSSNIFSPQKRDPKLSIRAVETISEVDDIKVSIGANINAGLICKGDPLVLTASVTATTGFSTDSDTKYEWYYIKGDKIIPIQSSLDNTIIVVGNTLTMLNGPELTTDFSSIASIFSIVDQFPGLKDIISDAARGIGTSSFIDQLIPNSLQDVINNQLKEKIKEQFPEVANYEPKYYSVPIGLSVTIKGKTTAAIPFTRPVFLRPQPPQYSITPTVCCQGDVVTFSSDDDQTTLPEADGEPQVVYLWMGLPNPAILNPSEAGLGGIFVRNIDKILTKGPFKITMDHPNIYTGNYYLSAFRGAPSPVGCSSIPSTTKVIVHGKPTSEGNTKLSYNGPICEGGIIAIKGGGNYIADKLLGTLTYKWFGPDNQPISATFYSPKSFLNTEGEGINIPNATVAMSGIYTRIATTKYGCSVTATINVSIYRVPTISISSSISCDGNSDLKLSATIIPDPINSGVISAKITDWKWKWKWSESGVAGPYTYLAKDSWSSDRPVVTIPLRNNKDQSIAKKEGRIGRTDRRDGKYRLTLTSKRFSGFQCSISKEFDVVIGSITNLYISSNASSNTICLGNSLSLSATPVIADARYKWEGPNNFSLPEKLGDPNVVVSEAATITMSGTYTLTVVTPNGCISSKSMEVVIMPGPIIGDITYDQSLFDTGKLELSATVTPTGTGPISYKWELPNKTELQNTSPLLVIEPINLQNQGIYTLTAIQDGCSVSKKVNVQGIVNIKLKFEETTVNGGNVAKLTASLPPGFTALSPIKILLHRNNILSTAVDEKDYKNLATSITIPVGESSYIIDVFTAQNNKVIDGETILTLEGVGSDGFVVNNSISITILDRTGDAADAKKLILNFTKAVVKAGDYNQLVISLPVGVTSAKPIEIELKKNRKLSSAKEGKHYKRFYYDVTILPKKNAKTIDIETMKFDDTHSGEIKILSQGAKVKNAVGYTIIPAEMKIVNSLTVPNVFTPDAKEIHSTWIIAGIEFYPNCSVKVYNRWGQIVFESIGYPQPWNGTSNHKDLPAGTYYYLIDLKDGETPLNGYVSIVR